MKKVLVNVQLEIRHYFLDKAGVVDLSNIISSAFDSYHNAWAELEEPEYAMSEVTFLHQLIRDVLFKDIYGLQEWEVSFDATYLLDYLIHDQVPLSRTIELVQQVFDAYLVGTMTTEFISQVCELRRSIIRMLNDAVANAAKQ